MSAAASPLPWPRLLALATAGFITILTEALPAGLLLPMADGLGVTPALVGQLVTAYALGSLLAAIPVVAATRHWRRRPLLMLAVAGFLLANAVTAISPSYGLSLAARFVAGVSAGVLWALLAGYAVRLAAPGQEGRAIAVAMVGTPLALSIGIPAGTWLGSAIGWRAMFGLMSLLSLALLGWMRLALPDFAGQSGRQAVPLRTVWRTPGLRAVLGAMVAFVLAHNLLYTYIVPLLARAGWQNHTGGALLLFGLCALGGIAATGALVDRWLRGLTLGSTALFGLACLALAVSGQQPAAVLMGIAAWGLAFGGAATLFQTACAQTAGPAAADAAQSMLVTGWNLAIAGGGLVGGLALQQAGAPVLPWLAGALLAVAGWWVWNAAVHGFPRRRPEPAARAQTAGGR